MANAPWTKKNYVEPKLWEGLENFHTKPQKCSCDVQDIEVSGPYDSSEHWPVMQLKTQQVRHLWLYVLVYQKTDNLYFRNYAAEDSWFMQTFIFSSHILVLA